MSAQDQYESLVILGGGYSAHLAGLALSPLLKLAAMVAPLQKASGASAPEVLSGQHAHSHIFLPRLEQEMCRIDPALHGAMNDQGLAFVPGSYRLSDSAPPECRRMFATRWQFDAAIEAIFRERVRTPQVDFSVSAIEVTDGCISRVAGRSRDPIEVSPQTLVLDAMGTRSPIMSSLVAQCSDVIDEPGNVVYITQFFRLCGCVAEDLPDPLIDCPHDFGPAAIMLYPATEGWFSVSMAIDASQKALVRDLRRQEAFLSLCQQNPHIAEWIDAAEPVGRNRIYINPRNTWNVGVFNSDIVPRNYLAVGDALTTMLPTLGANCSFAATHIRIVRDLIANGSLDVQTNFADGVREAQFGFFKTALAEKNRPFELTPFAASRRNRLDKKVKRWLRRCTGLDRRRIIKQLANSSSI